MNEPNSRGAFFHLILRLLNTVCIIYRLFMNGNNDNTKDKIDNFNFGTANFGIDSKSNNINNSTTTTLAAAETARSVEIATATPVTLPTTATVTQAISTGNHDICRPYNLRGHCFSGSFYQIPARGWGSS